MQIELESKGSESGISALVAGKCDIASSSRWMNEDEERLARSRGLKVKNQLFGYYGLAVIVNNQNPVDRLSDAQIRDVFTGGVRTWASIGGSNAPIHLYIRDQISGTYLGFQEMAMRPGLPHQPRCSNANAEIADAVSGTRPASVISMELAHSRRLKTLRINRVEPSILTVNAGDYPYSRGLRFYTIEGHESSTVQDFVAFVQSKEGQKIISDAGFVRRFESSFWGDSDW